MHSTHLQLRLELAVASAQLGRSLVGECKVDLGGGCLLAQLAGKGALGVEGAVDLQAVGVGLVMLISFRRSRACTARHSMAK